MPAPTKIKKTIRKIRKENYNEDKKLRDLRFLLDPEKDHYKHVKTVSAFKNNYIQYDIYMRMINNYKTKHPINYHQATFESLHQPF